MPSHPCNHCKCQGLCLAENALCKAVLIAWATNAEIPQCPFKEEIFYHGIEGVYA